MKSFNKQVCHKNALQSSEGRKHGWKQSVRNTSACSSIQVWFDLLSEFDHKQSYVIFSITFLTFHWPDYKQICEQIGLLATFLKSRARCVQCDILYQLVVFFFQWQISFVKVFKVKLKNKGVSMLQPVLVRLLNSVWTTTPFPMSTIQHHVRFTQRLAQWESRQGLNFSLSFLFFIIYFCVFSCGQTTNNMNAFLERRSKRVPLIVASRCSLWRQIVQIVCFEHTLTFSLFFLSLLLFNTLWILFVQTLISFALKIVF